MWVLLQIHADEWIWHDRSKKQKSKPSWSQKYVTFSSAWVCLPWFLLSVSSAVVFFVLAPVTKVFANRTQFRACLDRTHSEPQRRRYDFSWQICRVSECRALDYLLWLWMYKSKKKCSLWSIVSQRILQKGPICILIIIYIYMYTHIESYRSIYCIILHA